MVVAAEAQAPLSAAAEAVEAGVAQAPLLVAVGQVTLGPAAAELDFQTESDVREMMRLRPPR